MPRYAKKRDANEQLIVDALVAAGATVTKLGDPGVPDLLVGYAGRTFLLEVKEPSRSGPNRRRSQGGVGALTAAQAKWWALPWAGGVRAIVETVADAMRALAGL